MNNLANEDLHNELAGVNGNFLPEGGPVPSPRLFKVNRELVFGRGNFTASCPAKPSGHHRGTWYLSLGAGGSHLPRALYDKLAAE